MKPSLTLLIAVTVAFAFSSCAKWDDQNYPGGQPYDVVSILDIRPIYRGQDVPITESVIFGGNSIAAVVVSDHREGNLPEGLLVVQDNRRLGQLRGISLELGASAANYLPGDSVMINIIGGTLTRKNGTLVITGVPETAVKKMGKGTVNINAINVTQLYQHPENYESSLCLINKSSFNPVPTPGEVISGEKVINDGFGDLPMYTDPAVSYANNEPYSLAAYVGIPFMQQDSSLQFRTREGDDIVNMGSSAQDLLITGILSDPKGGDGGNEYVQLMATRDIDFSVTPYSIVFCNNAGTSSSATPLDAGWATGGKRTIKWNITSGVATKGKFFYFLFQKKKINGNAGTFSFPDDTPMFEAFYETSSGSLNTGDGGLKHVSSFSTSGPWANSGNTCGVALFADTVISETSVPEDVLFIASGGGAAIYDPSKDPVLGYRICNNDWYSMYSVVINQETYKPQIVPFLYYRSQGNTTMMPYPVNEAHPTAATDAGLFNMMGGVYNTTLQKWTTARKQTVVELFQDVATIDSLEKREGVTMLVE